MENLTLQRAKKYLPIYQNSCNRITEPGSSTPVFLQKIIVGILDFINGAKRFAMQMFSVINLTVFPNREKLLPSFSKLFLPINNEKCYRN